MVMSAQTQKVKQRVELKNGGEVVGYVAEQTDGSFLVETETGDMFFYTPSEIKKIVELADIEVKKVKASVEADGQDGQYKRRGYMGMVSGGIGIDAIDFCPAVSATVVNGYRFSPHFYLGIGTGFQLDDWREGAIPLYLYAMSEFSKKRTSMYMDFSYGFAATADPASHMEVSLGVRTRMKKNPNHAMWYGLSVCLTEYAEWYGDWAEYFSLPIIQFKISYSF